MSEDISVDAFVDPFPHLIIKDFYNDDELELIWEELKFYTKPGKLFTAEGFGGVTSKTNSHALMLDDLYKNYTKDPKEKVPINYRLISNILTVNRKMFDISILEVFASIHDCCSHVVKCNHDVTKVRYYHNGEYYEPHRDSLHQFLSFSYFFKEPKKFSGGEIYFPNYDYEYSCENNSVIFLPGWVEHGVREVKIEDSDYYDGYGRYCISSFFGQIE